MSEIEPAATPLVEPTPTSSGELITVIDGFQIYMKPDHTYNTYTVTNPDIPHSYIDITSAVDDDSLERGPIVRAYWNGRVGAVDFLDAANEYFGSLHHTLDEKREHSISVSLPNGSFGHELKGVSYPFTEESIRVAEAEHWKGVDDLNKHGRVEPFVTSELSLMHINAIGGQVMWETGRGADDPTVVEIKPADGCGCVGIGEMLEAQAEYAHGDPRFRRIDIGFMIDSPSRQFDPDVFYDTITKYYKATNAGSIPFSVFSGLADIVMQDEWQMGKGIGDRIGVVAGLPFLVESNEDHKASYYLFDDTKYDTPVKFDVYSDPDNKSEGIDIYWDASIESDEFLSLARGWYQRHDMSLGGETSEYDVYVPTKQDRFRSVKVLDLSEEAILTALQKEKPGRGLDGVRSIQIKDSILGVDLSWNAFGAFIGVGSSAFANMEDTKQAILDFYIGTNPVFSTEDFSYMLSKATEEMGQSDAEKEVLISRTGEFGIFQQRERNVDIVRVKNWPSDDNPEIEVRIQCEDDLFPDQKIHKIIWRHRYPSDAARFYKNVVSYLDRMGLSRERGYFAITAESFDGKGVTLSESKLDLSSIRDVAGEWVAKCEREEGGGMTAGMTIELDGITFSWDADTYSVTLSGEQQDRFLTPALVAFFNESKPMRYGINFAKVMSVAMNQR